ncbi:hypothetical protein GCM10012275_26510 [Longimycelium tulufanense]|uniref:Uncharacterized protein n=1 Tax=Longimycelium tulufanense TaxID=907463 RepID=A0A8J3FVU3_9PSEU|nr:hypothetical protein GCM10012275_26510 [Longimycelium tulufanense]
MALRELPTVGTPVMTPLGPGRVFRYQREYGGYLVPVRLDRFPCPVRIYCLVELDLIIDSAAEPASPCPHSADEDPARVAGGHDVVRAAPFRPRARTIASISSATPSSSLLDTTR